MSDPGFVHLRLHSEYSIVDGIVRFDDAVAAAASDHQPALAVTDLANGFGFIKFYQAARKRGVKPILGADVWISNDRDPDKPSRLLLLCQTDTGYRNLCELLSRAWLDNANRERGEIRFEWFAEPPSAEAERHALPPDEAQPMDGGRSQSVASRLSDGLIALSGGLTGEIGHHLAAGAEGLALEAAVKAAATFPDRFYIEIQRAGRAGEEAYLRSAVALANQLRLPVVATHPIQFLTPDDFQAHEARVCIAEGEIIGNPRRVRRFTPDQYLKSQAEMAALFQDCPAALRNTVEIAKRCNVTLSLGKARLPLFPTPNGMSLDDYMRALAAEGLERRLMHRFPDPAVREAERPKYADRLVFECDTIVQMGFSGYFLIVADFINWAKRNNVPVGPGRGSGAGSLVAYSLGITDLDPLPFALLFERFLNPERVSMPDFDIDFCQDNRWKVIEYVRERYGSQAVSQIATFGTMASKAVIRDAGRVLDLPYNFCDQLSKLIPVFQNKPLSLESARKEEPMLAERERNEEEVRELLALAGRLEDLVRNVGMHAGGVLIAPGRLTDFCPLYRAPGTEAVVSMYDKDDVELAGLVKFDFLGLRNLTIIDLAVRYINRREPDRRFALEELESFDDPAAYQVLKDGNTTAIFQVESGGMKKLLTKLLPDRFEDIIAVLALYRPGPLGSGMVDDFILRKKGQQEIDYFHPELKACLEPTYGVIVYQEQVMQIAQIIAGYTLGGADLLRRAMGKKKPEEMAKQREIFLTGAAAKGHSPELAIKLFDLMEKFAEYGFNKSHTAAYAVVTYQTAWLKAHYPAEFMAATLSSDMDDTDKVQLFVEDAKANGVKILPPDINASNYRFEPVLSSGALLGKADAIRYGLGAVKGTGESAVENIVLARGEGESYSPFVDMYDFARRIDRRLVNKRAVEALVRAGAFDAFAPGDPSAAPRSAARLPHRASLLATVARAFEAADQAEAAKSQVSLFGEEAAASNLGLVAVSRWDERQLLQEEKTALGLYLSGHLFNALAPEIRRFVPTSISRVQPRRDPQWIAGILTAQRYQNTKRGRMLVLELDDGSGKIEMTVFSELADAKRGRLTVDSAFIAQARIEWDDYSGGLRAQAVQILDLTEARAQFARRLRVRIGSNIDFHKLKKSMDLFKVGGDGLGGSPVVLEFNSPGNGQCDLSLPPSVRLKPDDQLIASLDQLGASAVVEYG